MASANTDPSPPIDWPDAREWIGEQFTLVRGLNESAVNHALETQHALGGVTRELAQLREEVRGQAGVLISLRRDCRIHTSAIDELRESLKPLTGKGRDELITLPDIEEVVGRAIETRETHEELQTWRGIKSSTRAIVVKAIQAAVIAAIGSAGTMLIQYLMHH